MRALGSASAPSPPFNACWRTEAENIKVDHLSGKPPGLVPWNRGKRSHTWMTAVAPATPHDVEAPKMQEWCSCNASFKTRSYRHLTEWRTNHRHDVQQEPEPDPQGTESRTELSYQESDDEVRMGFRPNPGYTQRAADLAEQLRAKALRNLSHRGADTP